MPYSPLVCHEVRGGQAGSGDSTRMGSALVRGEAGHDDVFQPAVARLLDSLRNRPPRLRVSFGTSYCLSHSIDLKKPVEFLDLA